MTLHSAAYVGRVVHARKRPRARSHSYFTNTRGGGVPATHQVLAAKVERAHGVDARGAHGTRAEMLDVRQPMSSSSRTPPKAHHVVAAGKHQV